MFDQPLSTMIFGRLSWDSVPIHEPILIGTFAGVALLGLAVRQFGRRDL